MNPSLGAMITDASVPVSGDLLRLAFHASRFHPDPARRAGIGAAIDAMLDRASAPPLAAHEAAAALALATGTALAPMVAGKEDAALAARFWRLVSLETWKPGDTVRPNADRQVFVGSADAVGAGQGALLAGGTKATFHLRKDRPDGVHFVHPGMARKPTDLALLLGGDSASLEIGRDGGVVIACRIAALPGKVRSFGDGLLATRLPDGSVVGRAPMRLDAGFVARRGADGAIERLSLGAAGLRADAGGHDGTPLRVSPETPEAAIRFAAACTDRPLLYLASKVTRLTGAGKPRHVRAPDSFDLVVQLAPLEEAPCALPCVRASHTGMLAEWMSMPAVAIALDLAAEHRAAIAAHYATT